MNTYDSIIKIDYSAQNAVSDLGTYTVETEVELLNGSDYARD